MERLAGLVAANYSMEGFSLLTEERPIVCLPYGSRYRLMDFPLSNIVNAGATTVGFITPHYYRSIMDHIGNGKPWNLNRKSGGLKILPGTTYGYDIGKGKLTVRDILGNLTFYESIKEKYIVISSGNKVFNINYKDVLRKHIQSGAGITLCYKNIKSNIAKNEYVIEIDDNDNVKSIKKLKKNQDGGNLYMESMIINVDLLLKVVAWYKDQSYVDLIDVIEENLKHLVVSTYEFSGYLKSINNVKDYMDANQELLNEEVLEELFLREDSIYTKIHDAHPVKYSETAKVENSIIGTGCIIRGHVKNSIVFRDCIIEEGVKLENCVIMQKSVIKKNAELSYVICDKQANITEEVSISGTEEKPIIITRKQYR